jgi:hypothetical protein
MWDLVLSGITIVGFAIGFLFVPVMLGLFLHWAWNRGKPTQEAGSERD